MGPPLQDFLYAFEPSDWVFPVAHSANCCVPSTSIWSLSLAQVPNSLLGRLTSILRSLNVKTRGVVSCALRPSRGGGVGQSPSEGGNCLPHSAALRRRGRSRRARSSRRCR